MFETISVDQVKAGTRLFWSMREWTVVKAEPNILGQIDIYLRSTPTGPADGHLIFDEDEFNHQLILA